MLKDTRLYKSNPLKKGISLLIGSAQQSKRLTYLMSHYMVVAGAGLFIYVFTSAYFHPSKAVTVFVNRFGEGYSEMYFLIPALILAIALSFIFVHKTQGEIYESSD